MYAGGKTSLRLFALALEEKGRHDAVPHECGQGRSTARRNPDQLGDLGSVAEVHGPDAALNAALCTAGLLFAANPGLLLPK